MTEFYVMYSQLFSLGNKEKEDIAKEIYRENYKHIVPEVGFKIDSETNQVQYFVDGRSVLRSKYQEKKEKKDEILEEFREDVFQKLD